MEYDSTKLNVVMISNCFVRYKISSCFDYGNLVSAFRFGSHHCALV